MPISRSRRADLCMLLITLIWGATFVVIKRALDDVPPFLYGALRFMLASAVGALVWRRHLAGMTRAELRHGVALGLLFGVPFLAQTWGLQHTTVSNSAFISGAMAVFTPIAAWLVDRRRLTAPQALSVLVVLTGLGFFSQYGVDQIALNLGDAATLASAAVWGFYITYTDTFMRDAPDAARTSARLVFVQFVVAGLVSLAAALAFEVAPADLPDTLGRAFASRDFLIALGYTAILASIVATWVQTRFQHETTPVKAAIIFSVEPVVATLIATALGMESVPPGKLLLGLLVIAGVLLGQLDDLPLARRRAAPP
jgi:drug/metabolite transporter (DMT)-like permease